jgi:hypothetical protein
MPSLQHDWLLRMWNRHALHGCGVCLLPICCQAEALEWGAPGYEDVVRTLASRKPELVLAGDDMDSCNACPAVCSMQSHSSGRASQQLAVSVSH